MAIDFSADPEWAEQLTWVDDFVRSECEPIDLIVKESHDLNDPVRQALWDNDQVAFVYVRSDGSPANGVFPDNPNGSVDDIAGVCDSTGLVLGLMPHPERYVDAIQHPSWTHRPSSGHEGAGLRVFQNAVRHVSQAVGLGV